MLDIPISALFVCYGPLAVTILGFLAFAVLTDFNARRSYLRRIDMRTEAEQDMSGPLRVQASKATTTETPTGAIVTIIPPDEDDAANSKKAVATSVEDDQPAPAPVAEAQAEATPDDLTTLEGIGPKIAQALVAAGYDTFAKVAAASMDDFREALEASGVNFAPSAESWAEQASFAASGDMEGLQALQDRLVSGRYPTDE